MSKNRMLSKTAAFLIPLSIVLSGCAILDYGGSLANLSEFTQFSDGHIQLEEKEFVPVSEQDLCAVHAQNKPFGYINDDQDNNDGSPFPKVYRIKDAADAYLYVWQSGFMMNSGSLYRFKNTEEPTMKTFCADKIQLASGDIPNPLQDSKIVETIDNADTVKMVCETILSGKTTDFTNIKLTYLRSVLIRSSKYPGLAFEYTLQRGDDGNSYLLSMTKNKGYKVDKVFDSVTKNG